jgi:hypothetical protein
MPQAVIASEALHRMVYRAKRSNLRRLLRHPAFRGIPRNDKFVLSFTMAVMLNQA